MLSSFEGARTVWRKPGGKVYTRPNGFQHMLLCQGGKAPPPPPPPPPPKKKKRRRRDKIANLLFTIRSSLPEGLCKRVVVNLELGNPVILVSCHPNECALHQLMSEDRLLVPLGVEAGDDHPRLVLVHGVQCNYLQEGGVREVKK